MFMYECKLLLPVTCNDGRPLAKYHDELTARLLVEFGGFTADLAHGAYKDRDKIYREEVMQYVIAITDKTVELFREICIEFGTKCRQKFVYYVIDGSVTVSPCNVEQKELVTC